MLDESVGFIDMTREQFQRHLDERSVNTHDPASVARWFAEDGVQRRVSTGEQAQGRDAIRDVMDGIFSAFPDFHLEVRELFGCEDRMCVEGTLTATHQGELGGVAPTGRRIEVELCLVFRLDPDGLVAEETIYGDSATMFRQLGLLPG